MHCFVSVLILRLSLYKQKEWGVGSSEPERPKSPHASSSLPLIIPSSIFSPSLPW